MESSEEGELAMAVSRPSDESTVLLLTDKGLCHCFYNLLDSKCVSLMGISNFVTYHTHHSRTVDN